MQSWLQRISVWCAMSGIGFPIGCSLYSLKESDWEVDPGDCGWRWVQVRFGTILEVGFRTDLIDVGEFNLFGWIVGLFGIFPWLRSFRLAFCLLFKERVLHNGICQQSIYGLTHSYLFHAVNALICFNIKNEIKEKRKTNKQTNKQNKKAKNKTTKNKNLTNSKSTFSYSLS